MSEQAPLDRRTLLRGSMMIGAAAGLAARPSEAQVPPQSTKAESQLVADQKLLLAQASRILVNEGVLDGPGHVSVRHPTRPDRYLMSRVCPPRSVKPSDILEFHLDSEPVAPLGTASVRPERFIHGQFYQQRPDVNAVVHSHANAVLPFTVVDQPIQVVVIDAARLGVSVPVWDIRDRFGDATNVMVTDNDRAMDLLRTAGKSDAVLIRGHGYVVAAESLFHVTHLAIKLVSNADVQQRAMALGKIKPFTPGELASQQVKLHDLTIMTRFWDEWLELADTNGLQ